MSEYTPVGAVQGSLAGGRRAGEAPVGRRNHFYSEEEGEESGVVDSRLLQSESGGEQGELPPNQLGSVNKSLKSAKSVQVTRYQTLMEFAEKL